MASDHGAEADLHRVVNQNDVSAVSAAARSLEGESKPTSSWRFWPTPSSDLAALAERCRQRTDPSLGTGTTGDGANAGRASADAGGRQGNLPAPTDRARKSGGLYFASIEVGIAGSGAAGNSNCSEGSLVARSTEGAVRSADF